MGVVAGGRERSRQGLHFFVHECDETAFQRLVPAELQPLSLFHYARSGEEVAGSPERAFCRSLNLSGYLLKLSLHQS
jgi:hypothetical protein